MRLSKKRNVVHLWIAILALLFSALAPSVSHAVSAASAVPGLAQMCSIDGVKAPPGKSLSDAIVHAFEHCPFCAAHATPPALPPPPAWHFPLERGQQVFSALYYHAPSPLFAWSAAKPRGPPACA
jgi:hypothetical protein